MHLQEREPLACVVENQKSNDNSQPNSLLLPRVLRCQRLHSPSAFCRTCSTVRHSHRQNAAVLVRRAHSAASQHNRRSVPSSSSSVESLDDAPSILERLKKDWEMGIIGRKIAPNTQTKKEKSSPNDNSKVDTPSCFSQLKGHTNDKGDQTSDLEVFTEKV